MNTKTDVGNELAPGEFGAHAREYASTMTNPMDRCYVIALADALDKATVNSHDALVAHLHCAIGHIEHMAAWIGEQQAVYSFEGLGEDMPSIRAALSRAKEQGGE